MATALILSAIVLLILPALISRPPRERGVPTFDNTQLRLELYRAHRQREARRAKKAPKTTDSRPAAKVALVQASA
jgi:hypothetical protein